MSTSSLSLEDCQHIVTRNAEYQKALRRIIHKVRNVVDLTDIFTTTNQDMVGLLAADRATVFRFDADWSGSFVNEYGYAKAPWDQLQAFGQNRVWEDSYLQENNGGRYKNHDPFAVADIYKANHARCHIEMLEQFKIRAYAIAPIFVGESLWGLLAVYQHSDPRPWGHHEVELLSQAADYLGIAVQHDQQRQFTAAKTAALEASVNRQQALSEVVSKVRSALDTPHIYKTACRELCALLGVERAAVYQFNSDWSGQFVYNHGSNELWDGEDPFEQAQIWEDTHLQETKGGRYRTKEGIAINDIYEADYARCHLDILEQYKIRAYAIAPIFINQKLWGLLAIYHHSTPHSWQPFETEFLAQIAAQVGVAAQQSALLSETTTQKHDLKQSMARQRALTKVVGKVRSSLDIKKILATTCQEVSQLLEIERVAIYRFNEDWSGRFLEDYGRLNPNVEDAFSFGQNQVWEDTHLQETKGGRYRNNETLAVDDVSKAGYARCHQDILEQYNIAAYALAPIFVGRKLWGLIGGYEHSAPRQWQDTDVDFLAQVASQLGVAIQSAVALKDSQNQAENLGQSAEQQQLLFDVVAKIRRSLDLDTIFDTTTRELRQVLNADRAGIFQFIEGTHYNEGKYIAENVLPHINSAIGMTLVDHCFGDNYVEQYEQGRMMVIPDIREVNFQSCHVEFLEQLQIKAQIVVSLLNGDKLWGFLCIHQCDRTRDWTDTEVDFVRQIASQLSVGLRQSNLLAKTQAQTEELETTLKELQSAQLQVIQSEKMASLGQLVAGVAHEVNNPINFIHGNLTHAYDYTEELLSLVNIYQQAYPQPDPSVAEKLSDIDADFIQEDLPKLFQSMNVGTTRIREIVTSLRNFSRLDESATKLADIHEGLESTLMILHNRIKPSADSSGIIVEKDFDVLPDVECFPGQLNQVFMNLLANAIDAIDEQNQGRSPEARKANPSKIKISTMKVQEDAIAIHISDNGPGVPTEVLDRIFDPFFTTKPVGKGTGLGLSISYQIITEKHNGKLYCNSSAIHGTEFVIEIPLKQPAEVPEGSAT